MPTSSLDLTGLASYELFLRGTLDKIGAFPDALHIGDYKTASNVYTEHTYTPAHREMAVSLNTDLYEQLVRGLADGRHKSEAEIRSLIDHGPYCRRTRSAPASSTDVAYEDELDDKWNCPRHASASSNRRLSQRDDRVAPGWTTGSASP
jgi:protease-4